MTFEAFLVFPGISGKQVVCSYMQSLALLGSYFSGKVTPQKPFKNGRDSEEILNNGRAIRKKLTRDWEETFKKLVSIRKKPLKTGTI